MSIIYRAEETVRADKKEATENDLDTGLKGLLDHVAVELAEEYVRLMEQAAEEQLADAATQAPPDKEGDSP